MREIDSYTKLSSEKPEKKKQLQDLKIFSALCGMEWFKVNMKIYFLLYKIQDTLQLIKPDD
jgi:hypothetical protein